AGEYRASFAPRTGWTAKPPSPIREWRVPAKAGTTRRYEAKLAATPDAAASGLFPLFTDAVHCHVHHFTKALPDGLVFCAFRAVKGVQDGAQSFGIQSGDQASAIGNRNAPGFFRN